MRSPWQILLIFNEPEEGKRFKANAMPDPITPVTTQDMNGLDRHIAESK